MGLKSLPMRSVAQQQCQDLQQDGTDKSFGAPTMLASQETPAGRFPKIGLKVIKNKKREKDGV